MTPAGIEPVTFQFVAQHLNHCATTTVDCMCTIILSKNKNVGKKQIRVVVLQTPISKYYHSLEWVQML